MSSIRGRSSDLARKAGCQGAVAATHRPSAASSVRDGSGSRPAPGRIATGRRPEATYFVISALGAEAVDQALKFWFQRPRPDVFFGLPQPWGYSFPSGHALVSSCFYLVLAEIVIEEEWPLSRKLAIWTLAALLTGMIGLSRVYLGVHYPTDVLGGYLGGIAWLAIVHAGHKLWRRRV